MLRRPTLLQVHDTIGKLSRSAATAPGMHFSPSSEVWVFFPELSCKRERAGLDGWHADLRVARGSDGACEWREWVCTWRGTQIGLDGWHGIRRECRESVGGETERRAGKSAGSNGMPGFFVRNLLSLSLLSVGVLTINTASSRLMDPSESSGERERESFDETRLAAMLSLHGREPCRFGSP